MTVKIWWTVSDGHYNENAPHYTEVKLEDLEGLPTEQEQIDYIVHCVNEDFKERVSFSIDLPTKPGKILLETLRSGKRCRVSTRLCVGLGRQSMVRLP